jgi:Leucine-zipper of ternary complex factor MIP1
LESHSFAVSLLQVTYNLLCFNCWLLQGNSKKQVGFLFYCLITHVFNTLYIELTKANFILYQSTKELIKDITVLELEVMYLEQHLLSMYRKTFMQQIPNLPLRASHVCLNPLLTSSQLTSDASSTIKQTKYVQPNKMTLPRKLDTGPLNGPTTSVSKRPLEKHEDLGRSHSSLLHRSVGSARVSPAEKSLRALKPCYTSPLTFQEVILLPDNILFRNILVDYPLI